MYNKSLDTFRTICEYLYKNTPTASGWKWDKEFGMILGIVKENIGDSLITMNEKFDHRWDYNSIDDSPRQIYQRVISLFGMIPGQIVFYREEEDGLALLAVLWPWGAERRISFRMGMLSNKQPFLEKTVIRNKLTDWFQIAEDDQSADWRDFRE